MPPRNATVSGAETKASPSPTAAATQQQCPSSEGPVSARRDPWRRSSARLFILVCLAIAASTFAVHQYVLVQDRSSLPIDAVIRSLERHCPASVQHAFARTPPRLKSGRAMGEDDSGRLPPPTAYGVAVWADDGAVLPAVRRAVRDIDIRLSVPANNSGAGADGEERYLFPVLRLQRQLRDDFVAGNAAPIGDEAAAMARVVALAEEQQLGMAALLHAFAPALNKETHMIGLSLIALPAAMFPFVLDPVARPALCHSFDVRQSFCVLLTCGAGGEYCAAERLETEVAAAVASVLAHDLRIDSFHPPDVARWHEVRFVTGCSFAVRSLNTLLTSIQSNPDMHIPFAVHSVFERLQRLVEEGRLVQAARAADDLQFEPLLTPQLYMPLDHSVLSQLLILLPIISMLLLSVRFVIEERKLDKRRAKQAAEKEKEREREREKEKEKEE